MMIINYPFLAAIGPLLLNVENVAEGFSCEVFQNTVAARIKAERPTATQNFWVMGPWKVSRRSTFYLKIVFSDEAHLRLY